MTAAPIPQPKMPRRSFLPDGLRRTMARVDFYPRLEIGFTALALLLGFTSYWMLTRQQAPSEGFSPPLVTLLVVANLVPLMALLVLIARRLALLVGDRRAGHAGSRLHVRLVALFSTIAAVPTLLVVVFASLLFQFGVQFWFSDRARTVLENADRVAQAYVEENKQRIIGDIGPMASDVATYAREVGLFSPDFREGVVNQVLVRGLTEANVFTPNARGDLISYAEVGVEGRPLRQRFLSFDLERARRGEVVVIAAAADRVEALVRLDPVFDRYLYVSRKVDPQVLANASRTKTALSDYKQLIQRSRALQWRFNAMLMVVSLLILAAAIWFALWLANRLVAPIGQLALAAERVGEGDFNARVPVRDSPDELGTLARAFNRMTTQLSAQKTALVTANEQLDRRREFTEAVLAGVSAGVMSIDADGLIRLVNRSAADLLEARRGELDGRLLAEAVPELAELLASARAQRHARGQVRIARGAETQTLAVRVVAEGEGYVVTFDDISQQLSDQRRAAWADVARRIAHEIKNPLTPIQLSAERLQRKYSKQISDGAETFMELTGTIVRQVGDLRRMVDEFSSFARMPKPVFRPEPVLDIVRQAQLLQEVAHPSIGFELDVPDALPLLVCDRRQIAQALTNLLKNAAESVSARQSKVDGEGRVHVVVEAAPELLTITVSDDGLGIPAEVLDRITEPYVTTRAKGTGLGLAIVKKIVEEHEGVLDISNRTGGGAVARMCFDLVALSKRLEPPLDEEREAMVQQG
jgi:two-component system nitrogen regulation sensor histidine kinase NtrY